MGPIRAEVEIDVPRERAFAAIADIAARPSFTDHFLSDFHLTRIESRGVGAGARFRVNAPFRKVWQDTAIVELEEPFRIVEEGAGGRVNRVRTHTIWDVTPGAGSLTLVTVSHWTEPTIIDRAVEIASAGSVWQERSWREALRRLRDILESDQLPAAERIGVAGGNRYATGIP